MFIIFLIIFLLLFYYFFYIIFFYHFFYHFLLFFIIIFFLLHIFFIIFLLFFIIIYYFFFIIIFLLFYIIFLLLCTVTPLTRHDELCVRAGVVVEDCATGGRRGTTHGNRLQRLSATGGQLQGARWDDFEETGRGVLLPPDGEGGGGEGPGLRLGNALRVAPA